MRHHRRTETRMTRWLADALQLPRNQREEVQLADVYDAGSDLMTLCKTRSALNLNLSSLCIFN